MSIGGQITVLSIYGFLAFCLMRYLIWSIKGYLFNNSAYRKHSKGESLKERFLYSRYRKIVPRKFIFLYFFFIILHSGAILLCSVLHWLAIEKIGEIAVKVIYIFDNICFLLIIILWRFIDPKLWLPKYHRKGKK